MTANRQAEQIELTGDDLNVVAELQKPGIKDSTILTLDSVLTLMRLFKAEAARALGTLPALIALNFARAPVYLLTWLSFCGFAAVAAAVLFDSALAGAGVFFLLHVGVAAVLEWKIRRLHEALEFNESRRGYEVFKASLKERLGREAAP